jgi:hypothetical protein
MSFGNELVFNEKKLHLGWDQKITYSFSGIYYPADYADEKEFVTKIRAEFCHFFDEIWKFYTEDGDVEEVEPLRFAAE